MQRFGYKLLLLAALIFLICALLIIIDTGPATGYEISIYGAYPPSFWFFIVGSLVIGLCIILFQAFSDKPSNWWVAGLGIVLVSSITIFLLSYFRGYVNVGFTDPQLQIGYVKYVLNTGTIGNQFPAVNNYYPMAHILVSNICIVTGIAVETVFKLIPAFFSAFYIVSMYLLGGEIAENRGKQLLITCLAGLPLFTLVDETGLYFVPRLLIFWLLPFVFYLFYRSSKGLLKEIPFTLLLLLALLAAPLWHPANGGLLLACLFLLVSAIAWLWEKVAVNISYSAGLFLHPGDAFTPALIALTVFLFWFTNTVFFADFLPQIENALLSLEDAGLYQGGQSYANMFLGWLNRAGISIYDSILLLLKRQGHQILYFFTAAGISFAAWWQLFFIKRRFVSQSLAVYSVLFLFFIIAVLVCAFSLLPYDAKRLLMFPVTFSSIVIGLGLYSWLKRHKRIMIPLLVLIITITTVQGVSTLYKSPFILAANDQVTLADIKGAEWFLHQRDEDLLTDAVLINQFTLATSVNGLQGIGQNLRWQNEAHVLDHFGYLEYDTYGELIQADRYILSNRMARVYYTDRMQDYPDGWQWTPEDYKCLENDPTVSRIYHSGEFEVFSVRSVGYE